MKKKMKGFTLIELLAVIVILAIIALIAVPVVMNIITKSQKSAFKDSAYGIVKAGELYYTNQLLEPTGMTSDKVFEFPNDTELEINGTKPTGGSMVVTKNGKVAVAIHNGRYCVTKGYEDSDVTITEDIENCEMPKTIFVNGIMSSENSCIKSGICSQEEILSGIKVKVQVNDSQTYDFYVTYDDGTEVELMMSENLGDMVAWYSPKSDDYGPKTAIAALRTVTENWENITDRTYEYSDEDGGKRYTTFSVTMKARLLTTKRAEELNCKYNISDSCVNWVYENLSSSGHSGYWLSEATIRFVNQASYIFYYGALHDYRGTDKTNEIGIRPVITLSK